MTDPNSQSSKSVSKRLNPILKLKSSNVDEVDMNLLRFQNTALSTKLDFLKKEIKTLKTINESLEIKVKNSETFLSGFTLAWQDFLTELDFVNFLLKNKEEDKLSGKFSSCFQFFDELIRYGDSSKEINDDVSKQIKVKAETLLKNIKNIFTEIFIEYQKSHLKITELTEEIMKTDLNELARKIFNENQNFSKKITDLEQSLNQSKNKIKEMYTELAKKQEERYHKSKMDSLALENEELRSLTECLTRRVRILSEYNSTDINNIIASKVEKENYDCICGGKNVMTLFYTELPPTTTSLGENKEKPPETSVEPEISEKDGHYVARPEITISNTTTTMEIESVPKEEAGMTNVKIQLEILEKQNQELINEKANLKREIENLNLFKNNYEETFFKSKTFIDLVQQSQELLKYTNNMKAKLIAANKKIVEIERLRAEELEEIFKNFKEEKQKLMDQIEKGSQHNSNDKKDDISNYFDISQFTKPLISSLEEANKNNETLKQEIQQLRKTFIENKRKYEEEFAKNMESMEKINSLSVELATFKLQGTGHFNYDQLNFKHAKYKEFLLEITEAVTKNQPNLRQKLEDLASYIKSRESKNEHYENKLRALNNELKNKQKQIEDLIVEIDLTGKAYTELLNTNKKLTEQIKDSDEIKAKIIKEKALEKKQFDQEKSLFQIKYNAEKEIIQQQNNLIQEIQKKEKTLEEYKANIEREINLIKKYNEELKIQKEELVKKNEEMKHENELMKKRLDNIDGVNNSFIEKYEASKKKVQQQKEYINKLLETTQDFKGNYQKTSTDVSLLKLEVEKYRKMIVCNMCEKNEKNVCLTKCFHTFCKDCINKSIQLRSRQCANCRTKFGAEDVKDIYWN